jgi:uncharacterized protein YukE
VRHSFGYLRIRRLFALTASLTPTTTCVAFVGNGRHDEMEDHAIREVRPVASVAEVKSAIDAVIAQIGEVQSAVRAAGEQLSETQQSLAAAVEGSGHDAVSTAQAALNQASTELDEALAATLTAVEQAQTYLGTL